MPWTRRFGRYRNRSAACKTRARVSGEVTWLPDNTSDTVACETPASLAICFWLTWRPDLSIGMAVDRLSLYILNRSLKEREFCGASAEFARTESMQLVAENAVFAVRESIFKHI